MSKSSSGSWWTALGFGGKAASAPDTDYADMGTAFGLDASFSALVAAESREDARAEPARTPTPNDAAARTKR